MEQFTFRRNCGLFDLAQIKVPMGTVRVDNECKMHAIDLICTVCKTNRDQAGKTLRRLLARKKFKESDITVHTYNHFQQKQKISMVSYADAIRLIMMLPGENSYKSRVEYARILHEYFAGDDQLKGSLVKNAESQEPLNVLARDALAACRASSAHCNPAESGMADSAVCK